MSNSAMGFSPWGRRPPSLSQSLSRDQDAPGSTGSAIDEPAQPPASARLLSSSLGSPQGVRGPLRSYIHASTREQLGEQPQPRPRRLRALLFTHLREIVPVDSNQNARTVREDTAELASYLLSDGAAQRRPSFLQRSRPSIQDLFALDHDSSNPSDDSAGASHAIPELSEPTSPGSEADDLGVDSDGPSVLSNLLKRSPPDLESPCALTSTHHRQHTEPKRPGRASLPAESRHHPAIARVEITEDTPLLSETTSQDALSETGDLEGQKRSRGLRWFGRLVKRGRHAEERAFHAVAVTANPRRWDRRAIWKSAVLVPASCLPAVLVGLLLNVLDALSYGQSLSSRVFGSVDQLTSPGMILFPLGKPIFAHLGSAGLSIYYVSTIVSQVIFSSGSVFKGAVGSELVRHGVELVKRPSANVDTHRLRLFLSSTTWR